MNKSKQKNITIPKNAMLGIAPAIAISAVLISKHGPGELLLFWVGISVGFFIAKGFFEKGGWDER
jgi:hypothetical protein